MSEDVNTADAGDGAGTESPQASFDPITSQEDLDRIINKAVARTHKQYADYGDLKSKVDAQKSEAEKAVEAARAEGAKEVASKYQKRLFEAEVRSHAAALKFRDAGDALSVFGDSEGLVSDDGSVDGAAIQKRLSEIASQKPYLVDAPSQVAKRPSLKSRGTKNTDGDAKPTRAADALRDWAAGR